MAKKKSEKVQEEEIKTLKFVVGGIIILAIALLAVLFYKSTPSSAPEQAGEKVLAVVNGQELKESDVQKFYDTMPAEFRQLVNKEQVLKQLIEETLLLQRAKELNIQITTEQIEEKVKVFLKQVNVDEQVLEASLERQGMSRGQLNDLFKKQLVLEALVEKDLGKSFNVSDKEILDYFNNNIDEFRVPPSTKVRHILIAFGNKSEEDTLSKAEEVRAMIKPNAVNFCELVQDYSDDVASKPTCGEYLYTEDSSLVPEFKEAGEKQGVGQITIVKTMYGYHILQTIAKLPERFPKFEEIKGDIDAALSAQKQKVLLKEYVSKLMEKASIKNLLTNEVVVPKAEEMTEETGSVTEEAAASTGPSEAPSSVAVPNLQELALCLSKKGAVVFGGSTDPATRTQLSLFGESAAYLNYVECSYLGNPNIVRTECTKKGVTVFPTWFVAGIKLEGTKSLQKLANAAGC